MHWSYTGKLLAVFPLFFISYSTAGQIVRQGDAYSGARSVSWVQDAETSDAFSIAISAFYPKGEKKPYSYTLELSTKSNYWQYLKCDHSDRITAVSDDRGSVLNIDMHYSNSFSGDKSREIFTATLPLESLKFLSESRVIIFSPCGTSGNISKVLSDGAAKIVDAEK